MEDSTQQIYRKRVTRKVSSLNSFKEKCEIKNRFTSQVHTRKRNI